jgi:hypothetical protein
MEQLLHKELSNKVLGMAFSVHNILGPGLKTELQAFHFSLPATGVID